MQAWIVKLLIQLDAYKYLCVYKHTEAVLNYKRFHKPRLSGCFSPHSWSPMLWPLPDYQAGTFMAMFRFSPRMKIPKRHAGQWYGGTGCGLPGSSRLRLHELTDITHLAGPDL